MKLDRSTYDKITFGLNKYEEQNSSEYQRMAINAPEDAILHILNIIKTTTPPYMVLYVLSTPRINKEGRYEISTPLNFDELKTMLVEYKEFFENDSRHELWLGSLNGGELLVYDNHDVIYAYNFEKSLVEYLIDNSFIKEKIEIPYPHTHNYYPQLDIYEEKLIKEYKWKRFDLKDEDEN